jgi:hypothetical protein
MAETLAELGVKEHKKTTTIIKPKQKHVTISEPKRKARSASISSR